jgi:hypothetical protein
MHSQPLEHDIRGDHHTGEMAAGGHARYSDLLIAQGLLQAAGGPFIHRQSASLQHTLQPPQSLRAGIH